MAYGWDEEVRADSPASRFRLGDARGSSTTADTVGGAAGSVRGTVTLGQPSLVESDTDGAALFDGSTGFVLVADRAGVKATSNGGISFWITPTAYTDNRGLPGFIYDGGAREVCVKWAAALDGRITVRVNGVGDVCTSLTTLPLGVKAHVEILLTYSASTVTARIIVNSSDVTGTVTGQTVTPNALGKCIGAADQGAGNFFAGTIDELAIYNAATITHQRARARFRAAFSIATTSARRVPHLDQVLASAARTKLTIPNVGKVGDLVCVAAKLNSTTVTPGHRDFTLAGLQTNTTASKQHEIAFLWHRVAPGDPSSWDITWDGSSITCEADISVVRGAPLSGDPVNVIAGAANSSAGTSVPFAGPTATVRGLAICAWSRFSASGPPSQPDFWHYGAGNGSGSSVGTWERPQHGAYKLPYMTNFTGGSDAWTTLQLVIADGGVQIPRTNLALGLDGVNSPNNRGNPGWPDGYTPALGIAANHVRTDFGPGMSQANADAEFADAAARGMRVLPVISQYQQISTIDKAAFAAYVGTFCARYGPGGAFWSGRSDGYLAPEFIEVFNEPWGTWFVVNVEPDHYADLYIQAVRAGRAANSRCKFLIAGIDRYFQTAWQPWFSAIFTAQPTLAQYVDGVTVHLYGTKPLDLSWWGNYSEWPQVESIAPDLYARGVDIGGAVKFWITECGFTTTSNASAPDYGVSEADQASQYLDALRIARGRWADLVAGLFPYRYRDGSTDTRENRWGVVRNNGTTKPAYTALQSALPTFSPGLIAATASSPRRPTRLLARRPTRIPTRH